MLTLFLLLHLQMINWNLLLVVMLAMKWIKHSPESTDDQFNNRFMGSQMSRPAEGAFKGRSKNMSAVTVTFAATVREFSGACSASSSSGEDAFRRKNSSHFNGI